MIATGRPKLCIICGASFPTPAERDAHREKDHPGYRVGWGGRAGREPKIVDPEGAERIVAPAEYQRMRRASLRPVVSIPPVPGPVDEPPRDAPPVAPSTGPETGRPFVAQPALRISRTIAEATMRDTVGESLTVEVLGDLIRQLSEAVSELDGAGPAGAFSPIQARQLAMLLHDSTVDLIVSRFRGNVTRFKLAMAAAIIVIAKGQVHAQAIAGRIAERRARLTEAPDDDAPAFEDPADAVPVTPPAPEAEAGPEPLPLPPVMGQALGRGIAG